LVVPSATLSAAAMTKIRAVLVGILQPESDAGSKRPYTPPARERKIAVDMDTEVMTITDMR
jgi:hypothetical protein